MITDPRSAEASLDPMRASILDVLRTPDSASGVARTLALPRQKVNYHLRVLEDRGLVEQIGERRKGNLTERIMQATAGEFVVAPTAAAVAARSGQGRDPFSARWLIALASRVISDVGQLIIGAARQRKALATFALDGELTFADAAARAGFVEELTTTTAQLIEKYHAADSGGRRHRLVIAVHPALRETADDASL